MKFLADMGISPRTAAFVRSLGYDTVHLYEQGLGRLSDTTILRKARDEGRVLLTHDLDFGELMAASGAELPSVVIFRQVAFPPFFTFVLSFLEIQLRVVW